MKFAIALLIGAATAQEIDANGNMVMEEAQAIDAGAEGTGGEGRDRRVTEEEWATFGPAFFNEMDKYYSLPSNSRLRRFWMRYMRGDADEEIRQMKEAMYEDGGAWDQYAGDDGLMCHDEAVTMNADLRAGMQDQMGEELPEQSQEEFDYYNSLYNSVSDGDCFSKADARYVDRLFNRMRREMVDWRPTDEQRRAFRPLWRMAVRAHEQFIDEDTDFANFYYEWLQNTEGAERAMHEMNKVIFGDDGPFNQYAGEDGVMNHDEARAYDQGMHEMMSEQMGEEMPTFTDEEFDQMYNAYDGLSDNNGDGENSGDGFDLKDAMIGQAIFNEFRNRRVTDMEMWRYYTLGEMWFEKLTDTDNEEWLGHFYESIHNPIGADEIASMHQHFNEYDRNGDGCLNRREWSRGFRDFDNMMVEMSGGEYEAWSEADISFNWNVLHAVQDGEFNRWHHHCGRDGVSVQDEIRLNRILHRVFQDIVEDYSDDLFWNSVRDDEFWEDSDSEDEEEEYEEYVDESEGVEYDVEYDDGTGDAIFLI